MLASSVAVAHRSNWIERDIREATVTTSPARRGEHDISRKAIAQGMSDASAALYARVRLYLPIAHETAGAACTRHSLRPLFGG
jgi:hypothetical protein